MLTDLLTTVVLVAVAWRLLSAARIAASGPGRARVHQIVRGIRFRHVWPVPFVLAGVGAVAVVLLQFVPPLRIGWWTALGGQGNPVFGQTDRTAGSVLGLIIPIVFVTLLLPALPLFAQREEEIFRLGAERRTPWQRTARTVAFGLVHALIGIPVGVALALSVGGLYFTSCYLRAYRRAGTPAEALLESTRAHTTYNGLLASLLLVIAIVSAITNIL